MSAKQQLANEIAEELTALYRKARDNGVGCAVFCDRLNGSYLSAVVGTEATEATENVEGSSSGFELLTDWLSNPENGAAEAVLRKAVVVRTLSDALLDSAGTSNPN